MKLRHFFIAAALAGCLTAQGAKPRYIFLCIGDGMGPGPVMAAQNYLRLASSTPDATLNMLAMPVSSRAQSWSASSPVTDSAAAGTALSTGSKTRNGMLGMNADTVSVTSIARQLKDEGYGIGIVTNCAADDATPGAFYAHVPNRSMYYEIGRDAASAGYDFLAGAHMRGVTDKKGDSTDLYAVIEQSGIKILQGAKGAENVYSTTSDKILLINPDGYGDSNEMGYAIDGADADTVGLSLAMVTKACLYHLERNSPDKYFVMIEDGLIDHSLHGNDGGTAIAQILSFDRVIGQALEVYARHPEETLIIVTADHDTGGLTNGCKATGYNAYYQNVNSQKISKGAFSDMCTSMLKNNTEITWPQMQGILAEKLGIGTSVKISEEQQRRLEDAFRETFMERTAKDEKGLYKVSNAFAATVFNVFNDATGLGFTTPNHTGNFVPVFAIGAGADRFTGTLNNTDIPRIIRELTK
ncbi:MAG: alkaline phosphatase [Bacteroidales bacterium]|nr:alkaline phosphatase [Bacteroidales bacterium]